MEAARITKKEVRERLDRPEVVIIDVRRDNATAAEKIKGAAVENPDEVERWQDEYPKDREIILYCS